MKILADENIHTGIINELRRAGFEIPSITEVGLAGCDDHKILEYSEKHDLILLSGDKDFGGLIEFGTLWGRGKVILLRYRLINTSRIAKNIAEVMNKEKALLNTEKSFVIVLSESGYRIHRHQD
jgi:predicted nuclease of predicted toxin-antitoxin system